MKKRTIRTQKAVTLVNLAKKWIDPSKYVLTDIQTQIATVDGNVVTAIDGNREKGTTHIFHGLFLDIEEATIEDWGQMMAFEDDLAEAEKRNHFKVTRHDIELTDVQRGKHTTYRYKIA